MLRTIIVEDEPLSSMYLSNLLKETCPDVEVVDTAETEENAVAAIVRHRPDVVFLDIELQLGSGFGVVSRDVTAHSFVIFTTALDHYATNLLRLAGVPFIQKPIDVESLGTSLHRTRQPDAISANVLALDHLRATIGNGNTPAHIFINGDTPSYVPLQDIVAVQAIGKSCTLLLQDGQAIGIDYELRDLDDLLSGTGFFRAHIRHLIRPEAIVRLEADGTAATLINGTVIPVSLKRLDELKTLMQPAGLRSVAGYSPLR